MSIFSFIFRTRIPKWNPPTLYPSANEYADSILKDLRAEISNDELVGKYFVSKVASNSIAEMAGIRINDILVSINEKDPLLDKIYTKQYSGEYRYTFYNKEHGNRITFKTFGGPIGIEYEIFSDSLLGQLNKYDVNYIDYALDTFWKRKEWDNIRKVLDMFGEFAGHTGQLLHGAWLYETKGPAFGYDIILDYVQNYEEFHVTCFHAIGRFYIALEQEKIGEIASASELISSAYSFSPIPRIEEACVRITGSKPQHPMKWVGQNFPDYSLPSILKKDKGTITLRETLDQMRSGQLLLVASMPSYRVNGVYYELVLKFAWLAFHFPSFLKEFHVIVTDRFTEFRDKKYHNMWIESENTALQSKYPLRVMIDESRELQEILNNDITPTEYLIDKNGKIVHQGPISDFDWWNNLPK